MADNSVPLTTDLGDPSNYQRAVGGGGGTVDIFGGFANILRQDAGTGGKGGAVSPATVDQLKDDRALDELATKANNIMQGLPIGGKQGGLVGFGKVVLDQMQRLQYSLEGGGVDQTFYDVKMDQLITEMQAKHPDSAYELYRAMNDLGIDHYVAREAKAAQAQAEQYQKDTLARQSMNRDAAAKAGAVTKGMSDMEIQMTGAKILEQDRIIKQVSDQRKLRMEEMTLNNQMTEADRKRIEEANEKEGVLLTNTIIGRSAAPLGGWIDSLYSLTNAAGEDGKMQKDLSEAVNYMKQQAEQGRLAAKQLAASLNLTEAQVKHIDEQFDQFTTQIDQIVSGPTSYAQTTTRNLQLMKNTGLVEAQELFPTYKTLVDGLGQEVTNALLQGTLAGFNPSDLQYLRDEMLRGMSNVQLDASKARELFQKTKDVLNGTVIPQFKTDDERNQALKTKVMGLQATYPSVVDGTSSKDGYKTWNNSAIGILGVGESVESTVLTAQNVDALLSTVFNAKFLHGWDNYNRDGGDPQQANVTLQYSAVVAAKTLDSLKNQNPDTLVYDETTGKFKTPPQETLVIPRGDTLTRPGSGAKAVEQANSLLSFLQGVSGRIDIVPDAALSKKNPDGSTSIMKPRDVFGSSEKLYEAMQNWADSLSAGNSSGLDEQSREAFYATLDKLRVNNGMDAFDFSGIQKSSRLQEETARLYGLSNSVIATKYTPVNDMNGYLDRTAAWESSGDPNAEAAGSSATGHYQFIESTWLKVMDSVPEFDNLSRDQKLQLRKDPVVSREMAERLTQENANILASGLGRPPSWDELYLAHFAGPGGAYEMITAPPSAPISKVLDADQLAANPKLKGKTVAQAMDILLHRGNKGFETYMTDKYGTLPKDYSVPTVDWLEGVDDGSLDGGN